MSLIRLEVFVGKREKENLYIFESENISKLNFADLNYLLASAGVLLTHLFNVQEMVKRVSANPRTELQSWKGHEMLCALRP